MRPWITLLLLFSVLSLSAQKNRKLSLLASYQPYDLQILSFGADYGSVAEWPKLNFEYRYHTSISGQFYLNQTDNGDGDYYGLRQYLYAQTNYVGLGLQTRIIFQGNRQRYEVGPSLKIGYKWIWLEYTASFEVANNPWRHQFDLSPMEFENGLHNLNLAIIIPIIKFKD